jgi:hypothetical protein
MSSAVVCPDLFICVLYKRNEESLRKVLRCFLKELEKEYAECTPLLSLLELLPLVGLRAMFMLLMPIDTRLRYWVLQYETPSVAKAPPAKVFVFLCTLRDDIVTAWMSDERKGAADLVETAKQTYIRC